MPYVGYWSLLIAQIVESGAPVTAPKEAPLKEVADIFADVVAPLPVTELNVSASV